MADEKQSTHVEVSTRGNVTSVKTGIPDAPATPTPAASPNRVSGGPIKLQMREDGSSVVTSPNKRVVKVGAPADRPFALDTHGSAVDLSAATLKSVATIPGLGDSTVETWVRLGVLKPAANGQGYVQVGQEQGAPPQGEQQQQQQQQEKPQEPKAEHVDLTGVTGTTDMADATLKALETKTPAGFEKLVESAAKGVDLDYVGLSRDLGVEGSETYIEDMVVQHRDAGVKVLQNLDPNINPAAFEAWTREQEQGDLASDIVRSVLKKDMSVLAKAGRQYLAARSAKVARIATAKGVDARVVNGVVYFDRKSLGLPPTSGAGDFKTTEISEAAARRAGVLEVNE